MPGKGKLEFTVVPDKARQLHSQDTRRCIEDLFKVQVKLSQANQEMQWITVLGPNARCKLAKAYMIALCDPVSTTEINCDRDLFGRLFTGDKELLRTIEGDYAVVIGRCQNYTARIQGSDELSVTLAMSKLNEIGCGDTGIGIDRHLSVAMEEQCDPTSLSSSLAHQPEVVKRTMLLEIVKDDSGSEDEAAQEMPGPAVSPQQEAPVEPQPIEQPDMGEEKIVKKRFRDRDVLEKIDYFIEIGYNKEVVMKVLERVGKKATVNSILDHLIRVSSSKPDTNTRPKMDANSRPPSRHHEPPVTRAPVSKSTGATNRPGKQSALRYIVIDGSNVAMSHGRRQVFSCLGIKCAVDYFAERGHKQITAFVPAWRKETNNPNNQITDPHILKELEEKGYLVFTPSRRTDRKRILPYDDRFIVRLAMETNGIILSNDYFRDLLRENESWRDTIENRVLPYTFVENFLMIPDDPLGANGPTLDEFLMCSSAVDHPSCPKPDQSKPAAEKKLCRFYPKCTFGNKCAFRHPDGNPDAKEETPPPRRENPGTRVATNDRHKVSVGGSYAHAVSNSVDEASRRESTRTGYGDTPKLIHHHSGGCLYSKPHGQELSAESNKFAATRSQIPAGLLGRDSFVPNIQHPHSGRHNSFPPSQQPAMYSRHLPQQQRGAHMSPQNSGPLSQQHSAHMSQQHSGPLSQQHSAHMSQQHSGPLSQQHSVHLSQQHSGPLSQQHSAHMSQQHSGPLSQQHSAHMSQQHSGPLSQQHGAHMSQQHSGPLSQQHSAHMSQQHSGPLSQQHSAHMSQQHSGPLSQQHSAHMSQQHSGPLSQQRSAHMSQHGGPLPPPYQGDINASRGNYMIQQQQRQQHYVHQMPPQSVMSRDPRYSQQPMTSYGHNMYPTGYPASHSVMHRPPGGMGCHVPMGHHVTPYEHYERDSKPLMSDNHQSTLVKQATSLLQGLTSEPIEPKVRYVLSKNSSLIDLDAIIEHVMEMD